MASVTPSLEISDTPWWRQLWPRLCRRGWLKGSGTTIILCAFFAAYLHILDHPAYPPVTVTVTWLDHWIGFYPPALWAYASLWLYLSLAPALLLGTRELVAFGIWIVLLCSAGLLIFYFWPTQVVVDAAEHSRHWGYARLRSVDTGGNACPSLHVATAVFTLPWFDRVIQDMKMGLKGRAFNVIWFAAICWSTLATKQHVTLDVAAGLLLGGVFAAASLWRRPLLGWAEYQASRGVSVNVN